MRILSLVFMILLVTVVALSDPSLSSGDPMDHLVKTTRGHYAGRSKQQMIQEAKNFLQAYTRNHSMVGMAVSVVMDNELVLSEGVGLAAASNPKALVDGDTIFEIGSLTKTFIAVAIGLLVEQGKLQWLDAVKTHLPWLNLHDKYMEKHLTIGDLLSMNSGFGGYQGDLVVFAGYGGTTERELTERLRDLEPAGSLRSGFAYANTNYLMLGEIIHAASGMSWDQFVQTKILNPLNMTRSFPTQVRTVGLENVAAGHFLCGNRVNGPYGLMDPKVQLIPLLNDSVLAAGSMVSTANDLSKFMRMLLNHGEGSLFKNPNTITEITSGKVPVGDFLQFAKMGGLQVNVNGDTVASGYGLDFVGHLLWDHRYYDKGGNTLVHCTRTGLLPEKKIGVVVLNNADHSAGPVLEWMHAEWIRSYVAGIFLDVPRSALEQSLAMLQSMMAAAGPTLKPPMDLPGTECGADFYDAKKHSIKNRQAKQLVGTYNSSSSPSFYGSLSITWDEKAEELTMAYGLINGPLRLMGTTQDAERGAVAMYHLEASVGRSQFLPFVTSNGSYSTTISNVEFHQTK